MAEAMTDERLAAVKARADAATGGPWFSNDGVVWGNRIQVALTRLFKADAEFIAHARTDVPALLAEADRLRRERDEARTAVARVEALLVGYVRDGHSRCLRINCGVCVANDLARHVRAALATPPTSPVSD